MATVSESYVVRIYRRDPRSPESLSGVVERSDREESHGFRSVDELLRLLDLGRAGAAVRGKAIRAQTSKPEHRS
jgi:hypothetical protein